MLLQLVFKQPRKDFGQAPVKFGLLALLTSELLGHALKLLLELVELLVQVCHVLDNLILRSLLLFQLLGCKLGGLGGLADGSRGLDLDRLWFRKLNSRGTRLPRFILGWLIISFCGRTLFWLFRFLGICSWLLLIIQ